MKSFRTISRIAYILVVLALLVSLLPWASVRAAEPDSDPSAISAELLALQPEFPNGTPWGCDKTYVWVLSGSIDVNGGCAAFAAMLQDRIFGRPAVAPVSSQTVNAPCTIKGIPVSPVPYDFGSLSPGDIIRFHGHSVLVVSVDRRNECITVVQANVGGCVVWGKTISRQALEASAQYILTRVQKTRSLPSPPSSGASHADCPCAAFADMPACGSPEHEAIDWAVTNKYASGMNASSFGVGKTLTRAQTAVFLYAAAGKPAFDETNAPKTFRDVPAGKWYAKAVLWAAAEGIVSGYADGSFKPNGKLTRGQIMAILYARAGKPAVTVENPYSDVPAGKWFTDSALWACQAGIERGADGKYAQSTPCTRDAFVLYLYRLMTGSCLLTDE